MMDTNKDTASKKMLQEALLDNKEFLRERIRDFCQNLHEEEMEAHLGAKKCQRINSRSGYRNGYKPRTIKTRVGILNLAVPQDRDGNFCPKLFDRYQRNDKVVYKSRTGNDTREFEALDFIASITSHIPNRNEQTVGYLGFYSNVCRGKRKKQGSAESDYVIEEDLHNKSCSKS